MKVNEFVEILKNKAEVYKSEDDKFIRIICDYIHINDNICLIKPSDFHIVGNDFVQIDEKVRIHFCDINEVMVL